MFSNWFAIAFNKLPVCEDNYRRMLLGASKWGLRKLQLESSL